MKSILIAVLLSCSIQMYAQLDVETKFSIKDRSIIVTLQNNSKYKIFIPLFLSGYREIAMEFVDTKGDTLRNTFDYNVDPVMPLKLKPGEVNKTIFNNIDFYSLLNIKVHHHIGYTLHDTVYIREKRHPQLILYDRSVDFNLPAMIDAPIK